MELPLAVRFKQLKATSKETVGVYRLDFLLTERHLLCWSRFSFSPFNSA